MEIDFWSWIQHRSRFTTQTDWLGLAVCLNCRRPTLGSPNHYTHDLCITWSGINTVSSRGDIWSAPGPVDTSWSYSWMTCGMLISCRGAITSAQQLDSYKSLSYRQTSIEASPWPGPNFRKKRLSLFCISVVVLNKTWTKCPSSDKTKEQIMRIDKININTFLFECYICSTQLTANIALHILWNNESKPSWYNHGGKNK